MNIPYQMFLTIQMHLTCRKDCIQSPTRKKDETCFEEQVTTVQERIQDEE